MTAPDTPRPAAAPDTPRPAAAPDTPRPAAAPDTARPAAAPDVTGTWLLTIATPIGRLPVTLVLAPDPGGLTGTATGRDETVPLKNVVAVAEPTGMRLTWQQAISKPMRLNLSFDMLVNGTTMAGHSRAGRLPRSTVTGVRSDREGNTPAGSG